MTGNGTELYNVQTFVTLTLSAKCSTISTWLVPLEGGCMAGFKYGFQTRQKPFLRL